MRQNLSICPKKGHCPEKCHFTVRTCSSGRHKRQAMLARHVLLPRLQIRILMSNHHLDHLCQSVKWSAFKRFWNRCWDLEQIGTDPDTDPWIRTSEERNRNYTDQKRIFLLWNMGNIQRSCYSTLFLEHRLLSHGALPRPGRTDTGRWSSLHSPSRMTYLPER